MAEWVGVHPVPALADADPRVSRLQRFPVKALDPERVRSAPLVKTGALAGDRRWAIVDRPPDAPFDPTTASVGGTGDYVNGKKTARVHRLRSTVRSGEAGRPVIELRRQGDPPDAARQFHLAGADDDRRRVHASLDEWLSAFFDRPVSVRRIDTGAHDDRRYHGPTLVSTATLREVAAWFDFSLESARQRFRANVEIGGVPPFWEDRCFAASDEAVAVRLGSATVLGLNPCQRCVVPGRDPDTGREKSGFRERFIEQRRKTRPAWTASERYDHDFRLMVNTRVPERAAGTTVSLGDDVAIEGTRPV